MKSPYNQKRPPWEENSSTSDKLSSEKQKEGVIFSNGFGDLLFDGSIDTGTLSGVAFETHLEQIEQMALRMSWTKVHYRVFKPWWLTDN